MLKGSIAFSISLNKPFENNLRNPGIEYYFCLLVFNLSGAERDAKAGLELEEQLARRKDDKKAKKEEVAETGEEYTTRTQVEETAVEGEEYDKTTNGE